ncbi:MAG: hypothetical protein VKO26_07030, partial [Cyanobacteriota bacterium]|nr:hypothetical protein [Cyanobacteriota bacterium]
MSRRETADLRAFREGTSHASRSLPALDPEALAIDERTDADWLTFAQRFCRHLIFHGVDGVESHWEALATPPPALGLSNAAIAAAIDHPERLSSEAALWLGRPHFALLLTALVLFRHLKAQQNALVRRHLDHFQRERLGATPLPARPDRVAVFFELARGVAAVPLPAGTALKAGKDSLGVTRTYRTETDLLIRRARVSELRTVLPLRRIRTLAALRRLTPAPGTRADLVEEALRLALGALTTGEPRSGAPLPPWPHTEGPPGARPAPLTLEFLAAWRDRLAQADTRFHLRHDELRELLVLVRRRTDAGSDQEWAAINRLLGFTSPPANPRAFLANLELRVGQLDLERDGLSQVNTVEDLYRYRDQAPVRAFVEAELVELADPGLTDADARIASAWRAFIAVMEIKQRIDAEWRQIQRLLERAGRRARPANPGWRLTVADPADFPALLTAAYNDGGANRPSGTAGVKELEDYDREMRRLEDHVSLLVERFALVAEVAHHLITTPATPLSKARWDRLLTVLDEAHKERFRARGRQRLEVLRQQ